MSFACVLYGILQFLRVRLGYQPMTAEGRSLRVRDRSFLSEPSRPVSWEKLEKEAAVVFSRGWPILQEREANDSSVFVRTSETRQLLKLYATSSLHERAALRDKCTYELRCALHHFAWRMAVSAMRLNSEEPLRLGLMAISLEDLRIDMRDTLTWLSLLHYASVRIHTDGDQVFLRAAGISSKTMGDTIRAFLSTSPECRAISGFGFSEGLSDEGPTLVRGRKDGRNRL